MQSQSPPLMRDCPLACLTPSPRIVNPLRDYLAGEGVREPTVGDVVRLWEHDRLRFVKNLGPGGTEQLLGVLVAAGLIHQHHHHG
ncbi:hypothetical protein SAMN04489712_13252 [Thermomonospora echinospora]|uniref:Uncharacterized protein n=1 Tax=Thermomonospora echinospora TaxID=1992 RepID=A0A1H6E4G5_9ACTN|nr:hypothetical protein [Thermomonospora echinospora]SEG92191.1 hypothetical protein SAMN04489712_13252 [Thermomonospora echinospora]